MKDEKIEVKEIVLNIEGKEIKLSPEKARELMDALKKLFPDPTTYTYPVIIRPFDRYTWPYDPWNIVYLGSSHTTCQASYSL